MTEEKGITENIFATKSSYDVRKYAIAENGKAKIEEKRPTTPESKPKSIVSGKTIRTNMFAGTEKEKTSLSRTKDKAKLRVARTLSR